MQIDQTATTKFNNPYRTLTGKKRAFVPFKQLEMLWINTGTLCNLSCSNCYIESSPTNDNLEYMTEEDLIPFVSEIQLDHPTTKSIGLTGGEPFLNPHIIKILTLLLKNDFEVLVLTNAYRLIERYFQDIEKLNRLFPKKLQFRVSLDHYQKSIHEKERGPKTFEGALKNIKYLVDHNFETSIATRSLVSETQEECVKGMRMLMKEFSITLELNDQNLIIFPEMETLSDVPEISTECWDILDKKPTQQMCATQRMVVRKKGVEKPIVLPCTLITKDSQFDLGNTLKESLSPVYLNHPFCSQFCVLGDAKCSNVT
jgi:sulfatase maturation enzyme AslB (radical SAM superfamily)